MAYALVVFGTVVAVELLFWLPLLMCVKNFSKVAKKSMKVVSSNKISDHWKEKVVPCYAGRMLVLTLKLTALIASIVVAAALPIFVAEQVLNPEESLWVAVSGLDALALSCVVAFAYYFVRKRYVKL